MSKTVVKHIRFNMDKEQHRRAVELLQAMDGNRYPTFADAISDALIAWFDDTPSRAGLNAESVLKLVEPYVVKLSEEVLRLISEKLPTANEQGKADRNQQSSADVPADMQESGGQYADAIPLDEIPWEFLQQ